MNVHRKNISSADSLDATDRIMLCNPRKYDAVTVYLSVYYFDQEQLCILKASAMDHVGKSDVFLGATCENKELVFHVSNGVQNVDLKEDALLYDTSTVRVDIFDCATRFKTYFEEHY